MDEQAVQLYLSQIRAAVQRNEEEHAHLLAAKNALESLLRLRQDAPPMQLSLANALAGWDATETGRAARPSLRGAIIRVLRDSNGEQLHAREILSRVRALGVDTKSKDAVGVVDLVATNLSKEGVAPIVKIAPRTWKWTESKVEHLR